MATKIFYTSDIHFSHRAICAFSPTRIETLGLSYDPMAVADKYKQLKEKSTPELKDFFAKLIHDYDEAIIEKWNDTVALTDEVYVLGDMSFARSVEDTKRLVNRLNGRLYLIRGNHDLYTDRIDRWEWVRSYYFAKIRGSYIAMSHFPFAAWERMEYGAFHLHGHVHSEYPMYEGKILDVAMESTKQVLVDHEYVVKYMETCRTTVREGRMKSDEN